MPQRFKNTKQLVHLPQGIISVYAQITGPDSIRSMEMVLDTGASLTMVPPEKIMAIGYKIPVSQDKIVKIFTASGVEYVPVVMIDSLSALGITVRRIEVLCHRLSPDSPVEGLLGLNFLSHLPAFAVFFKSIRKSLKN